jgi:hypothetical protein
MASPGFKNRKTPGVYITELTAFPPSIVGIQTAVPAFVGYTEKASIDGKPVFNKAIKIGSLADFELIFGKSFDVKYVIQEVNPNNTDGSTAKGGAQKDIKDGNYDFKVLESKIETDAADVSKKTKTNVKMRYYDLVPQGTSQFNLYESMRFFYANGGGNCYVVSVGGYQYEEVNEQGAQKKTNTISLQALTEGLDVIKEQVGPTMLVIPEAILLAQAEYRVLTNMMLEQCAALQDRVALLDVHGAEQVSAGNLDDVISAFRAGLDKNLNYGMAYFPFLHSTVCSAADYNYTNIVNGNGETESLETILRWANADLYFGTSRYVQVDKDIEKIEKTDSEEAVRTLNQNLTAALPLLLEIEGILAQKDDILPPSPAMAGIFTRTDATKGVWNAPANVSLDAVTTVTYKLNNTQQGDLNVPVDGKAVNALREFPNRGTVVWGARTLDGNSADWRYIQVRRTLIYIEQSIRSTLDQFVFAPNDGNTWVAITSMVSNFLQGLWAQGGLMGATANEAFSVECGLGSTMTAQDILDGYMVVQITLQMIRPAEFIELTFKQKMEGAA